MIIVTRDRNETRSTVYHASKDFDVTLCGQYIIGYGWRISHNKKVNCPKCQRIEARKVGQP